MTESTGSEYSSDPQMVRLRAALSDAERRLDALENRLGLGNPMVEAARKCLEGARGNRARAVRYLAWDYLHQFDDEMLAAMTNEERDARWCTLRAEAADKLKGTWRGKAADFLVEQAPAGKHVPLHTARELHAHLATAAQNQQHKLDIFEQRSLPCLTASLAAVVAAALGFSCLVFAAERFHAFVPWARALVLGISAGTLGGILSMAFTLGRADLKARIPAMRLSGIILVTRPLLGAAVAIPVLVFIQAGYVKVTGFEGDLGIFAFCFLGGFSERWFLGVMERFEAGKR